VAIYEPFYLPCRAQALLDSSEIDIKIADVLRHGTEKFWEEYVGDVLGDNMGLLCDLWHHFYTVLTIRSNGLEKT
jgi:hypothetical protein